MTICPPLRLLVLAPPSRNELEPSRYSFVSEELRAFVDRDVEVHTVSPNVAEKKVIGGITVHPIPNKANLSWTMRSCRYLLSRGRRESLCAKDIKTQLRYARTQCAISRLLAARSFDLIYSPFAWPHGTAGTVASSDTNTPVIISLRGADVLSVSKINYGSNTDEHRAQRFRQALQKANHIVGVSGALIDAALEFGAPASRVSVVTKGVDHKKFEPGDRTKSRQALGLGDDPLVLFVGSLTLTKGLFDLLDAFAILGEKYPRLKIVACGRGSQQAELEAHRDGIANGSRFQFAGYVDRETIASYYHACDLLVLPSLSEGSGNVLLEAAACGKPAVGTRVGGIPEYIVDGTTGFLANPSDPADLAEKLATLLGNENLRADFGQAARRRVEESFRYEQMIDNLLELFRRAVESRAANNPPAGTPSGPAPNSPLEKTTG